MSLSRRAFIAGSGAMLTLPVRPRPAAAQEPRFFRIATGPTDSSSFAIGTVIGGIISAPPGGRGCDRGGSCGVPGLIAITQTTAGAVASVDAIKARQFESGLVQADVAYWAYNGSGPYRRKGEAKNLRAIANLYREALHVVVPADSPIKDLRGLRGKTVAIGERDSTTASTVRSLLQGLGFSERDVRTQMLTAAEGAEALRIGAVAALFEMSGTPSPVVADLAAKNDIRLLDVSGTVSSRLLAAYPFLAEATIPATVYRGVPETPTISVGVVWIVDADVPEKLVQGIATSLWHPNHRRVLDAGHPYGRLIRPENALNNIALQLHPGAALYYFQTGMLK